MWKSLVLIKPVEKTEGDQFKLVQEKIKEEKRRGDSDFDGSERFFHSQDLG